MREDKKMSAAVGETVTDKKANNENFDLHGDDYMETKPTQDVKSLLSSVAIKPGDVPRIKFELKRTVIKASTRVPKNTFFRAHPEHEQMFMMVPSGKGMDVKMFIIGPGLTLPAHLAESIVPICCHMITFPDGELRILERKTAQPGEPLSEYQQSSLNVINAAKQRFVMRKWDSNSCVYEYIEADEDYAPEPEWPEEDFMDILCKAYEGRIIDSPDHPVYLELAGKQAITEKG